MANTKCEVCGKTKCPAGKFRWGTSCAGDKNGYACKACTKTNCPDGQYRSGTCSGASNGYACAPQPACAVGQYLKGSSTTAKGTCAACAKSCAPGRYLAGDCGGTPTVVRNSAACGAGSSEIATEAGCREAARALGKDYDSAFNRADYPRGCLLWSRNDRVYTNTHPTGGTKLPSNTAGVICMAPPSRTATVDGCKPCTDPQCQDGHYRSGTCGGGTNAYKCTKQPTCAVGTFLRGASNTTRGSCVSCATAADCAAEAKFLSGHCGRQPHLRPTPCPAGTSKITDEAACRAAAEDLGKTLERPVNSATYPSGCYFLGYSVQKVFFNTHAPGGRVGVVPYVTVFCMPTSGPSDPTFDGCLPCANAVCARGQYRSGACTSTSTGSVCTQQPTCTTNQYLRGATKVAQGSCTACANITCPENQYRSGKCAGTTNGFVCRDRPECTARQYLANYTSTSIGVCADQPICASGQYLQGSSAAAEGTCTTCSNATCALSQYRSGSCGGTDNGYECRPHPACVPGQVLTNANATHQGTCTPPLSPPPPTPPLTASSTAAGHTPPPITNATPGGEATQNQATAAGGNVTAQSTARSTTPSASGAGNQSSATGTGTDGGGGGGDMMTIFIIAAAAALVGFACVVGLVCLCKSRGADDRGGGQQGIPLKLGTLRPAGHTLDASRHAELAATTMNPTYEEFAGTAPDGSLQFSLGTTAAADGGGGGVGQAVDRGRSGSDAYGFMSTHAALVDKKKGGGGEPLYETQEASAGGRGQQQMQLYEQNTVTSTADVQRVQLGAGDASAVQVPCMCLHWSTPSITLLSALRTTVPWVLLVGHIYTLLPSSPPPPLFAHRAISCLSLCHDTSQTIPLSCCRAPSHSTTHYKHYKHYEHYTLYTL